MTKLWLKTKAAFKRSGASAVAIWMGALIGAYLQHFSTLLGNMGLATAVTAGFMAAVILFTKVD